MYTFSINFRKPFKKLGFEVNEDVIKNIIIGKPWAVEQFLMMLCRKIDRHLFEQRREKAEPMQDKYSNYDTRPEADQPSAVGGILYSVYSVTMYSLSVACKGTF